MLPLPVPVPEGRLAGGAPPASPAGEALPLDREQLKELLVDILQDAARGEGVEV